MLEDGRFAIRLDGMIDLDYGVSRLLDVDGDGNWHLQDWREEKPQATRERFAGSVGGGRSERARKICLGGKGGREVVVRGRKCGKGRQERTMEGEQWQTRSEGVPFWMGYSPGSGLREVLGEK